MAAARIYEDFDAFVARFDGAYSLALLNAVGDMLIARDPLGIKPMCYAKEGQMFAVV